MVISYEILKLKHFPGVTYLRISDDLVCKSSLGNLCVCPSVCDHFGYAPASPGMIGQPGHSGCSATHRKAIIAFEVARMAFEVARPGGSRTMQQSGMLMACGSSGHPTTNRESNPGVRVGNTKRL